MLLLDDIMDNALYQKPRPELVQHNAVASEVVHYDTIIMADPHPVFCEVLLNLLGYDHNSVNVVQASSIETMVSTACDRSDTLIIVTLTAIGTRGSAGLNDIRRVFPKARVAVICDEANDGLAVFALENGADWAIRKTDDMSSLRATAVRIRSGISDSPIENVDEYSASQARLYGKLACLTPKQMTILRFLRDGLLNKQIAYELGLTEATVKHHISLILKKLSCYRRTQAVAIANRMM